jgi:LPXTG-site transpeptidase (sortase) family protein
MRQVADKLSFYVAAIVCNVMVWGMFTVLSIPRTDVSATSIVTVRPKPVFVPTVGNPVRVVVPDLGIDVAVAEGAFDPASQEWSLSDQLAYHAAASVPANDNNGATLIYGHAKAQMFEPLINTAQGMRAEVHTDNSKIFVYEFSSMREVVPTDVSVFTNDGPPILVLQTCSGPMDIYRALYSFNYVEVRTI